MTLTRRDQLFIGLVGFVVVLACAIITMTRPAEAQNTARAATHYTIVHATGNKPTAYCPHGTQLLGGGGHGTHKYTYSVGGVDSFPVTRPHGQTSGWEYYLRNTHYSTIETTAFAICASL